MTITRTVSWGDAIVVELFRTTGGLKAVVDAIVSEVGPTVGTRNTFAKLLRVSDPRDLADRDQWRSWLLLTALHQNPAEWEIGDEHVPGFVNAEEITARLRSKVQHQGLKVSRPGDTENPHPDDDPDGGSPELPRLDSNQQPSDQRSVWLRPALMPIAA